MVNPKLYFGCVAAIATASPSSLSAKVRSLEATIVAEPVRPRYGWGVLSIFTELLVRDGSGRHRTFYLPYGGEGHVLPKLGQRCSISYRYRTLRGWVVERDTYLPRAPVVGRYSCSSTG